MIKSRINYWSCSKFANWIRGEEKPLALGFDEWDDWHKDVAIKRPVRHFIAEEVLDRIQDIFFFPLDLWRTMRVYWHNRFVSKMHCLKTDLPPGRFYDLDTRILHGLFNELKEFVEVDLGNYYAAISDEKFKVRRGRCPEAGVAHLEWAMALKIDDSLGVSKKSKKYGKPTPQAEAAKETMELYRWWQARDSRQDSAEATGWSDACKNKTKVSDKKMLAIYKKMELMDAKYDKEDEEMLIRLIKIRKDLWC